MADGAPFLITGDELDPAPVLAAVRDAACGAVASFVGTVRGNNDGRGVLRLEYEVHESMALRQFERMAAALTERHGIAHFAVHHRRGVVPVGGIGVALAASAPRRGAALAACREAIELLKKDVPIWKKEIFADGSHRWVEGS